MICVDNSGKIVIRTDIQEKQFFELQCMKKAVLRLLATQDTDFHNKAENYWAFRLVELLEPEEEQIILKKNK